MTMNMDTTFKTTVDLSDQSQEVLDFVKVAEEVLSTLRRDAIPCMVEQPTRVADVLRVSAIARNTILHARKTQSDSAQLMEAIRYHISGVLVQALCVYQTAQGQHMDESYQELLDTVIRKNIDYGSSFDNGVRDYGIPGCLIRLGDKESRLGTLTKSNTHQVDESVQDTLLDIAGYSLLTLVLLQRHPEYFEA